MSAVVWAVCCESAFGNTPHANALDSVKLQSPLLIRLATDLSSTEQQRAKRFHNANDILRFTLGRFLVRKLLKASPSQYELTATGLLPSLDNGIVTESVNGSKPSLNSLGKRLYPAVTDFNISHDGNWVLAGTTTQGILGVDIAHVYLPKNMAVDKYINELSLQASATDFTLSAEEIHFLAGQGKQKLFDFYRIWTIKEAYVKAIGTGIAAIDLRQVCVELPLPDSSARVRVHGELVPLKFITGVLGDDSNYVYALATSCDVNCKFRIVSLGELLA